MDRLPDGSEGYWDETYVLEMTVEEAMRMGLVIPVPFSGWRSRIGGHQRPNTAAKERCCGYTIGEYVCGLPNGHDGKHQSVVAFEDIPRTGQVSSDDIIDRLVRTAVPKGNSGGGSLPPVYAAGGGLVGQGSGGTGSATTFGSGVSASAGTHISFNEVERLTKEAKALQRQLNAQLGKGRRKA